MWSRRWRGRGAASGCVVTPRRRVHDEYSARGGFGRCCRTRALLLDAISAGQVVLEDVRAARLAGLRMVECDRLFLRSGARRAANCGKVWFRGSLISGRDAQRFHACAALPPVRTRRLTFLRAGRGHTTSASSSAIICNSDRTTARRSCSRTSQPRNGVEEVAAPPREEFDKDGQH